MLNTDKTVEIRLWKLRWTSPDFRVLKRFSHVVETASQRLSQHHGHGRLGPFGSAREAYEAADEAGLQLGMTVKELEAYMTREWKILDGPRKGELETVIVLAALFELLDVHEISIEIRRGVAWRGVAWLDVAWLDLAWRDVASHGVAWRRVAWRAVASRGVSSRRVAWCGGGAAWRGVARRGAAWRGVAWRGAASTYRPTDRQTVTWTGRH